jgi:hypothetical protein
MSAFTDRVYRNLLRSFGSQTAMAASKPATRRGYGGNHPHVDTEPSSHDVNARPVTYHLPLG